MRAAADSSDFRCLRAVSRDPAGQRLSYAEARSAALATYIITARRMISGAGPEKPDRAALGYPDRRHFDLGWIVSRVVALHYVGHWTRGSVD